MTDNNHIVRKVISNMLRIRNYIVDDEEYKKCDEFYLTHKTGDVSDKIYVYFPQTSTKVGVLAIRQYIKEMQQNNVNNAIIVVKEEVTSFAKAVFQEAKPLILEHFRENELLIDKLSHVLVPKHELLSEDEKRELYKTYKIKDINLPKILSNDPITRYFGGKKGQIFKITRPSESSGEYIYYRIII